MKKSVTGILSYKDADETDDVYEDFICNYGQRISNLALGIFISKGGDVKMGIEFSNELERVLPDTLEKIWKELKQQGKNNDS